MNKKALISIFCSLILFACSKNDYTSSPPTWKGFTYKTGFFPNYVQHSGFVAGQPFVLNAGDSIHITAHQDQRGRLIYATDYTWTICYDILDSNEETVHVRKTFSTHTNYDGYLDGADDPVGHLFLPTEALPTETGKPDTIKFVAYYKYSGTGLIYETGNIGANTSVNGRIIPQSNSRDGGAVGYIYFTVPK